MYVIWVCGWVGGYKMSYFRTFFGNNLLANGCRLEFELANKRVVQDRLPFLYEYQLPDANESLVRSCTNRQ